MPLDTHGLRDNKEGIKRSKVRNMAKLHLVFGGELKDPSKLEFLDISQIDIVGIFPNQEEAQKAWRSAAQRTVDSALTRYFIADLSKLKDPEENQQ